MLSVSEGRQINTTKHFGGGVNVSAGATLLIKGWCSLSQIHTRRTLTRHTRSQTHQKKQSCIPNPAEPPTSANKNGQLEEQRLLLLPPQLSLTAAFYIHADMEHQRLA